MKKLMSLCIVLLAMVFVGCTPIIEYVPKVEIKEVKVPVAMKIKRIECEFSGETPDIVIDKMIICLKKFKTYNEYLINAAEEINNNARSRVYGKK